MSEAKDYNMNRLPHEVRAGMISSPWNTGPRNSVGQTASIILDVTTATRLMDDLCVPRNSGALVVRQLLQQMGFDETKLFQHRFDHKLIQANVLAECCPGVSPNTIGAVEFLKRGPLEEARPRAKALLSEGYFLKATLGEGSGERENYDRSGDLEALISRIERDPTVMAPHEEPYVFQQRLQIARELRVHSLEDVVVPELSYDRYSPNRGLGADGAALAALFVQSVLDKLPHALVKDALLGWDIAIDERGRPWILEVNSAGMHPVYKPGFQCSGFFQTDAWRIHTLALLIEFVGLRYSREVLVEEPRKLNDEFTSTYWLLAQYLRFRREHKRVRGAVAIFDQSNAASVGVSNSMTCAQNTILWMVAAASNDSEGAHLNIAGTISSDQVNHAVVAQSNAEADSRSSHLFYRNMLRGFAEPTRLTRANGIEHQARSIADNRFVLKDVSPTRLSSLFTCSDADLAAIVLLAVFRFVSAASGRDDNVIYCATARRRDISEHSMSPLRLVTAGLNVAETLTAAQVMCEKLTHLQPVSLLEAAHFSDVVEGSLLSEVLLSFEASEKVSDNERQDIKQDNMPGRRLQLFVMVEAGTVALKAISDWSVAAATVCEGVLCALNALVTALGVDPKLPFDGIALVSDQNIVAKQDYLVNHSELRPVHMLFEEQARRTPNAIAAVSADESITYEGLSKRSWCFATHLLELGCKKGDRVAVCCERSIDTLVAVVAIFKAGLVYVPLDPSNPLSRLQYMMADCGAAVLVEDTSTSRMLSRAGLLLKRTNVQECHHRSERIEPAVKVLEDCAAYIMYTSGSTGKPKGAITGHLGLSNRIVWMQTAYVLRQDEVIMHKTSCGFDVSMWELWWPLIAGARLMLAANGKQGDVAYLIDQIVTKGITVIHFVPPMLRAMLADGRFGECRCLKRVICSGDVLSIATAKECLSRLPSAKLYNLYGPTEASIDATAWECSLSDRDVVPIGSAITNMEVRVCDHHMQPVPLGVIGEIILVGVGVGHGYVGNHSLTNSVFLKDRGDPRCRLYKTGDLGSFRSEGQLLFKGRADNQLKVRGVRVEVGDVEACLSEVPGITHVVVTGEVDAVGDTILCAYYVPDNSSFAGATHTESKGRMIAYAKSRLPPSMIPTHFEEMGEIPLNANGKIDRRSLAMRLAGTSSLARVVPERIQRLVELWQQVMPTYDGRMDVTFMEMGGDSLKAIRFVNAVSRLYGIDIPMAWLLSSEATMSRLAEILDEVVGETP